MFDSHRGQKIFSLPCVVPCFPLLDPEVGSSNSGLYEIKRKKSGNCCYLVFTLNGDLGEGVE